MADKWEYMLLALKDLDAGQIEERLNELGADRWEAFAFVGYNALDSIALKRRVEPVGSGRAQGFT